MGAFAFASPGRGAWSRLRRWWFAEPPDERSPASTQAEVVLASLAEWANERGSRLMAMRKAVVVEGQSHWLPKLTWHGGVNGSPEVRVGIFAGLDAGSLDTVRAAARVLERVEVEPARGEGYALMVYPKSNVLAFGEPARNFDEFQRRTEQADEEDGRFFREEMAGESFSLLIRLHSDGEAQQFHAVVRGSLMARCVVAPALEILTGGVPMAEEAIVLKSRRSVMRIVPPEDCLATMSRKGPAAEVELHAPANVPLADRVSALADVTVGILAYYRSLLSLRAML